VGGAVVNLIFLIVYWTICGTSDAIVAKKQPTKGLKDDVEAFQADARPTLSCKTD
jgi:hypothetical protein